MSDHDETDSRESGRPGPERLTRNLDELLQELRVIQTGVQILTGFLLTIPFSSRFSALTHFQVRAFLVVLCGSVLTTGFVVAPVAFHRVLFRRRKRYWLVEASHRVARIGLGLLALTSSGVLFLVFDVSVGAAYGIPVFVVALLFFTALWVITPLTASTVDPPPEQTSSSDSA